MASHDTVAPPPAADPIETTVFLLKDSPLLRTCEACVLRLIERMNAVPGIRSVSLENTRARLVVSYDRSEISLATVQESAAWNAAAIARSFDHRTYRISGMDCAHCAEGLEQMASVQSGIVSATVQFSLSQLNVEYEAARAEGLTQIERRAEAMGFPLTTLGTRVGSQPATAETPDPRFQVARPWYRSAIFAAVVLLAIGFCLKHLAHAPTFVYRTAFIGSILIGGYRFGRAGLAALREKVIGTNLLMAVAALGAVGLGQWEEAASVVILYAAGVALEGLAMERTRRSLHALIDTRANEATVQRSDLRLETVSADEIEVGDVLVVRPGAKIAADGQIISGSSDVVEAALTGEALPKSKHRGDTVHAGSINGEGSLLVMVTAASTDSMLARMLQLVEEAQARKAPVQAVVERFGHYYTPVVLLSAICVFAFGSILAPGGNWLYRSLTLLVVACPCALLIGTPVAYVSAITQAARNGILLKGGGCLESLAATTHIFLDKTGTLTRGHLHVSDVVAWDAAAGAELRDEATTSRVLRTAAALEEFSEHPLARAIVIAGAARTSVSATASAQGRYSDKDFVPPLIGGGITAVPGRGIVALLADGEALVGTRLLLSERGVAAPEALTTRELALMSDGKTTVWVAVDGQVIGLIAVSDSVRPEASSAVSALKGGGRTVALLTGDNEGAALAAARATGIEDCRSGLLPQDKLVIVAAAAAAQLPPPRKAQSVIFIGDGINDAPALAAATVSIAMGAGTAAALEVADIALATNDLSKLPWLLSLARSTRTIVRANIALAVGSSVILLLATVAGKLTLPFGVLGHEGAALLVILNGMRLLSPRRSRIIPDC